MVKESRKTFLIARVLQVRELINDFNHFLNIRWKILYIVTNNGFIDDFKAKLHLYLTIDLKKVDTV